MGVHSDGPSATSAAAPAARWGRAPAAARDVLAALLCFAALAWAAPTTAVAAPALSWSTATIPGAAALTGISCASNTLCAAVDEAGDALISTDPSAGAGAIWSRVKLPGAAALTGISCASNTLCVAVDKSGDALLSTNPTNTGSWSPPLEIDKGNALSSVSCASNTLCVAVDSAGRALISGEPAAAGSWHPRQIDSIALTSVSCSSAPAGVCVAVDEGGNALASGNIAAPGPPTGPGPTWSTTPIEEPGLGPPTAVSCAAAGLCVAVENGGGAYISDDPTAAAPSWTFAGIDTPTRLSGVSCVSSGMCAAVDRAGRVLITQVPPPAVATSTPSAVAETTATLAGTVNPEDATLTECRFEYGPSEAYGASVPCATPLPAGGASQPVSAAVSGLAANTTYHYRLVASSASGAAVGLGVTFKTGSPGLVVPHPSIAGIPARGQKLTCKSGVSGSGASSATLAYAWLRDTVAISGAGGSTYTVSSADLTHHLQCRVTATNAAGSASASSAFVTVPAGGLGSISETQVGTPRVTGGSVSVPLTCSAQAAGSCTIVLRLTVVETLKGSRVVAVAAAQRTRRATVTVGASTVHVPAGQRRTATVALNATGRRLLARVRRMGVKLSVSGTVVGAISAPLRSATLTLGSSGKASSRKASRSRGRGGAGTASSHRG
jgi:hypothetical protein